MNAPAGPSYRPAIDRIVGEVADRFGCSPAALYSKERAKSLNEARLVAYYVARHCTRMSYPELGRAFGRNHTSIHAGVHRVGRTYASDPFLSRIVAALVVSLGGIEQ